jgi:homoserine kinase
MALRLYNTLTLSVADKTTVEVEGEGAGELARDDSNLVLRAASKLAELAGKPRLRWSLRQENRIPLARGLGSSSAAIVGGLFASNQVLKLGFSANQLLDIATEIEGHPDNVAPALVGGLTVCARGEGGEVRYIRTRPDPKFMVLMIVPDLHVVSTEDSRRRLPEGYSRADCVFNLSHTALTLAALEKGRQDLLCDAMRDKLHQDIRLQDEAEIRELLKVVFEFKGCAAVLSGSGPSLAAFCDSMNSRLESRLRQSVQASGFSATLRWLRPALRGVHEVPAAAARRAAGAAGGGGRDLT